MASYSVLCKMVWPGAIIGDGDCKRALFLVLGLSLWYGTVFLFLEQIEPSCVAHARTRCEDFCRCSVGKWRPKFPKCLMFLAHNSIRSCLLEFLLQYFRRKLLQLEWSKTVSKLAMSCFISLTKLCFVASFTRAPHYSTVSFTYVKY